MRAVGQEQNGMRQVSEGLVGTVLLLPPLFVMVAIDVRRPKFSIGLLSLFPAATAKVRALGTAETP